MGHHETSLAQFSSLSDEDRVYSSKQAAMLDEKKLKKKILLRVLGSPVAVLPFMLGVTSITATWALNWNPAIGLFAGLAGILGACGAALTRLLISGEKITRQVSSELTREEQEAKQKALDELDQQLSSADKDPRPEAALRDLRALLKAFEETQAQASELNFSTAIDIQLMAERMFDQCVQSLDQTSRLWQTAQKLHALAARKPLLDQREKIIADVQAGIKQLSGALVALQTSGSGGGSTAELSRIREELDQSLAVAKVVEERVNSLVKEAGFTTREQSLQLNEKSKGQKL